MRPWTAVWEDDFLGLGQRIDRLSLVLPSVEYVHGVHTEVHCLPLPAMATVTAKHSHELALHIPNAHYDVILRPGVIFCLSGSWWMMMEGLKGSCDKLINMNEHVWASVVSN